MLGVADLSQNDIVMGQGTSRGGDRSYRGHVFIVQATDKACVVLKQIYSTYGTIDEKPHVFTVNDGWQFSQPSPEVLSALGLK